MKKFIFICGGDAFHPTLYPELFQYLASKPKGMAFFSRVLAFEHEGDTAAVYAKILSFSQHPDEFFVFEIANSAAKILDNQRNERFRQFYQDTIHP